MKQRLLFLSEVKSDSGLYWVEALREGKWFYPTVSDDRSDPKNYFQIDQPTLAEMDDNFKRGIKGYEQALNIGHQEGTDCGWVLQTRVGASEKEPGKQALFAGFKPTKDSVKKDLDDGTLKYCSSEIDLAWVDPESCATTGDCKPKKVFEGLALTNKPYVKRMGAVRLPEPTNLSEYPCSDEEKKLPGTVIPIATVGPDNELSESHDSDCKCADCRARNKEEKNMPTLAEAQAEIEGLKKKLADAEAKAGQAGAGSDAALKLAELEAQAAADRKKLAEIELREKSTRVQLELSQVKEKLLNHVRRGALTSPLYQKVLRFCDLAIRGDAKTITLSGNIKAIRLTEDKEDKEYDKLDVVNEVLDMLDNIPDHIATDPDRTELSEATGGPSREPKAKDDDEALHRETVKLQEEATKAGKKLSYLDAARQANEKLKAGVR